MTFSSATSKWLARTARWFDRLFSVSRADSIALKKHSSKIFCPYFHGNILPTRIHSQQRIMQRGSQKFRALWVRLHLINIHTISGPAQSAGKAHSKKEIIYIERRWQKLSHRPSSILSALRTMDPSWSSYLEYMKFNWSIIHSKVKPLSSCEIFKFWYCTLQTQQIWFRQWVKSCLLEVAEFTSLRLSLRRLSHFLMSNT